MLYLLIFFLSLTALALIYVAIQKFIDKKYKQEQERKKEKEQFKQQLAQSMQNTEEAIKQNRFLLNRLNTVIEERNVLAERQHKLNEAAKQLAQSLQKADKETKEENLIPNTPPNPLKN